MIRLYAFHQAPRMFQAMSEHGGDEDFVILIPNVGSLIQIWDSHTKSEKNHIMNDDDFWRFRFNVVDAIAKDGRVQNAGTWNDPNSGITYQVFITAHA